MKVAIDIWLVHELTKLHDKMISKTFSLLTGQDYSSSFPAESVHP